MAPSTLSAASWVIREVNWTPYWFGVFAGAVPWIAIAIYLIGSGNEAGGPPGFVYAIFFTMFLFFNVFAVNMVLQYKKSGNGRTIYTGRGLTSS